MGLDWSILWPFVVGTVLIVLLPGANSLYVLTTSARTGVMAGTRAAAGVVVGDAILMALSIAGAATILQSGDLLFTVLKWAGSAYLVWLGVGLLRSGVSTWRRIRAGEARGAADAQTDGGAAQTDGGAGQVATKQGSPFTRALFTCLLNPKSILFFAAFFVQFIDPDAPNGWLLFLVLGLIMQLVSVLYLGTLIVLGAKLGRRIGGDSPLVVFGLIAAGLVFCGFAVRLALGA
jgi:leucine efflux protein